MIPKVIHYCWFGKNPLPEMAKKCIGTWKKYCPDYEIIEWNEENFDIHYNDYVKEAYEAGKWAFVSDVVRLYVLVKYGGIYMDTDVEVIRSLDDLLQYEAVSGFESFNKIPTGLMASQMGNEFFKELLHDYDDAHFICKDGSYDTTTNVIRITEHCMKYGLILNNCKQTINSFTIFPSDYFCPKNYETKEIQLTKNTYVIHHFDGSWLSEEQKYALELKRKLKKFVSLELSHRIAKLIACIKYRGILCALYDIVKWVKKS